jgi:hypothetical protein
VGQLTGNELQHDQPPQPLLLKFSEIDPALKPEEFG